MNAPNQIPDIELRPEPGQCRYCLTKMGKGLAMTSTYRGTPDFAGDRHPMTLSPGGPGKLIQVWKCPVCGYSHA